MCVLACSLTITGTFNPLRARIGIVSLEEDGLYVPMICRNCDEPVCAAACPAGAIKKNENGLVEIDIELCTNCRTCRDVCPYAGPSFDPVLEETVVCHLCGGEPKCVQVCSSGALTYSDDSVCDEERRLRLEKELAEMLTVVKSHRESGRCC